MQKFSEYIKDIVEMFTDKRVKNKVESFLK